MNPQKQILSSFALFLLFFSMGLGAGAQEMEPIRKKEKKQLQDLPTNQIAMTRHILPRIQQRKMSWQFYQNYTKLMEEAAGMIETLKARSGSDKEKQETWVAWCRQVGALFAQLEPHKKVMDEIRLRNSSLPKTEQRQAYEQADREFQAIVLKLEGALKQVPDGLERTLEAMKRRDERAKAVAAPEAAAEPAPPAKRPAAN